MCLGGRLSPWGTLLPSWPCMSAGWPRAEWPCPEPSVGGLRSRGISAEDALSAVAMGAGRPLLPCPVLLAGSIAPRQCHLLLLCTPGTRRVWVLSAPARLPVGSFGAILSAVELPAVPGQSLHLRGFLQPRPLARAALAASRRKRGCRAGVRQAPA